MLEKHELADDVQIVVSEVSQLIMAEVRLVGQISQLLKDKFYQDTELLPKTAGLVQLALQGHIPEHLLPVVLVWEKARRLYVKVLLDLS